MHNRLFFNIERGVTKVSEALAWLSGMVILISGFLITYGALTRYFLRKPTGWELEIAIYLLMATAMFAAASALHANVHVSIDILTNKLSPHYRSVLYIVTGIIGAVFSLVMVERGARMWYDAYVFGWKSSGLGDIPMIYPYAIIPLAMFWFFLQYVVEMWACGKKLVIKKKDEK